MRPILPISLLLAALGGATAGIAAPCTGFKWDVSKELALFAGPGVRLLTGKNAASAAAVALDRLYELQLVPQRDVAFALIPGKVSPNDGGYAGLAVLHLDVPGNYRIAVDAPLWIDVVADGRLMTPTDFQGQHSCDGPHKIVEFDLIGTQRFVLQLSGATAATVRMTVTRTPPRTL